MVFNPNPFNMPLQNGVLELETGEFRPYKAEDLFTFKYGAKWDETADYKRLLWTLCSSLPDPLDVLAAIDVMTATAIRIPFNVVNLLIGGGANRKGSFEDVLLALFTQERSTALRLDELSKSRFGPGALFDMDLWIVSEVEGVKGAVNALKLIATGEFIDSDRKYGDRIKGSPHAMPIIDTNKALDFGDSSYGRKRRINKLDFPYTFGDLADQRPEDKYLKEKLISSEGLAGAVQLIAARAPDLIESRRVFNRKTTDEMEEESKRQEYSFYYFCDECLGYDPSSSEEHRITPDEVYKVFLEYCQLFNVPTPGAKAQLGKYIQKRFEPGIKTSTDANQKTYRYYPGLVFKKTPTEAYVDFGLSLHHGNHGLTTVKPRDGIIETTISGYINEKNHGNHGKMLSVVEEIWKMYTYISSCENVRDIYYEKYLENAVVTVVTVVKPRGIVVSVTTDKFPPVVSLDTPVVLGEKSDEPISSEDQPNKIDQEVKEAEPWGVEKAEHPAEAVDSLLEDSGLVVEPAEPEPVVDVGNGELPFERPILEAMGENESLTVEELSLKTRWPIHLCRGRLSTLVMKRGWSWSRSKDDYRQPEEVA